MAAIEFLRALKGINAASLNPFLRVLLCTDGTITEILEAYFFEPIQLIKLSQKIIPTTAYGLHIGFSSEETLLERKIILRGKDSKKVYAYAESVIAHGRLNFQLRDELINSDTSLGLLLIKNKLETHKELVELGCVSANKHLHHFESPNCSQLLFRTYQVITNTELIMKISEYFPVA